MFQNSKDAVTGAPLDLPAVHFLCGHSFNVRSLGENEHECPLCAPQFRTILDIRRSMRAGATEQVPLFLFAIFVPEGGACMPGTALEIRGLHQVGANARALLATEVVPSSARWTHHLRRRGLTAMLILRGHLCSAGECWQAEASCFLPSGQEQQEVPDVLAPG